jgi:hypothetical protein
MVTVILRNLKKYAIFIIIALACNMACAQNAITTKKDSLYNNRAQSVYAELLGPAILYSFNYDTRFSKKQDGLGMRIGISYAYESSYNDNTNTSDNSTVFSIPFQLNYLLGKEDRFFEVGLGFTYFNYVGNGPVFLDDSKSNINKVLGTMTFGYRYQPKKGGFTFRYSLNPVFDTKSFIPWWVGVSIGYSFNR